MTHDQYGRQFRRVAQFVTQLHRHHSLNGFRVRFENDLTLHLYAIIFDANVKNHHTPALMMLCNSRYKTVFVKFYFIEPLQIVHWIHLKV